MKEPSVIIYGRVTPACFFCIKAKDELVAAGIDFKFVDITENEDLAELFKMHHTTIPQVYLDGVHMGGSEAAATLVLMLKKDAEMEIGDLSW